ncbi:MAG: ATP-binding protein [Nanoarchaeota archaeon]
MPIYFISGGPGFGKTKLVEELFHLGYNVAPEAAREVAENDLRFKGKDIGKIEKKLFQDAIFERQKENFYKISDGGNQIVFSDRGFPDSVAFYRHYGLRVPEELLVWAYKFKSTAFILESLDNNENDSLRVESKEERLVIHEEISKTYDEFGYKIISVPKMLVEERAKFILQKVKNL